MIDKELAGWPCPKSCSQLLSVQMKNSDGEMLLGISSGTHFAGSHLAREKINLFESVGHKTREYGFQGFNKVITFTDNLGRFRSPMQPFLKHVYFIQWNVQEIGLG